MIAHDSLKSPPNGNDTAVSVILASDGPRDQKRPGPHVRHFHHALWQIQCEGTVLRCNLAEFSQKEEISLALDNTAVACFASGILYNNVWGIGLSVFDLCVTPSTS